MYRQGSLLAGRYRLDDKIGGGGMGEVWRGTDTELERTVAVKTVRSELLDEPGFRERFRTEARTMAKIKHPGVVAVHDYYSDESGAFLVMEFVQGEALSQTLRRLGRLDPARAMRLMADAAEALQAAHDQGVVHRDIKPANLMLAGGSKLVLTDFGIARSAASTSITATGAVIGTASYLAPEQVLGKPATVRSDVYALGVVAYECLSGRRPFDGENPFDIALQRLREPPPPITVDVPQAVLQVVNKALAAEPEQRWQTAGQLATAARQAATAAQSAPTSLATGQRSSPATPAPPSPYSPASASPPPQHSPPPRSYASPPPPSYPSAPPSPPPYARPAGSPPPYAPAGYRPGLGPGARRPNNTMGLLSMIFGILSIPLTCCYIGPALGVAAIVMGGIGMKKVADGEAGNRGMALAGLICGTVGVLLTVLYVALIVAGEISGL